MKNHKISITITQNGDDHGASISFECINDTPTFRITMVSAEGDKETLETTDFLQAMSFFTRKAADGVMLVTPRHHRTKAMDDALFELLGDDEPCDDPKCNAHNRSMVN